MHAFYAAERAIVQALAAADSSSWTSTCGHRAE